MEKYGVDRENDPVEKKARELEKKGNLNQARETAAKEHDAELRHRKNTREASS